LKTFQKYLSIFGNFPEIWKSFENFWEFLTTFQEFLEFFWNFHEFFKTFLKNFLSFLIIFSTFYKIIKNFWKLWRIFLKLFKNVHEPSSKKNKISKDWGGRHGPNNPPSWHPWRYPNSVKIEQASQLGGMRGGFPPPKNWKHACFSAKISNTFCQIVLKPYDECGILCSVSSIEREKFLIRYKLVRLYLIFSFKWV
jgi:hypothetical protein